MNCRRNLILFLFLPVLLLWPWFSGFSVQAEAQYTIYESELLQLEQNLTTLENHSREKQRLLSEQAKQLDKAREQLKIVNEQLKKSKEWNEMTLNSLENANQSLALYEQEAARKIRIKTRQRNMWILISAGLGYLAAR
nr:MAG TPA: PilA, PilC, PilN, PilO, PilM, pilus, ring, membrane channel [Caudoviricetes sp.]